MIAAWAVLPSVLVGVAATLAGIAVLLVRSEAVVPDPVVIGVAVLVLVAWAAVGFAAGILLPVPVAVPIGILLPFVWLAFVPAVYPLWLRHLTGMFRDCCGLAEDLAAAAVVASALVNVGFIVAASVLIAGHRSMRRIGASVVALAVPLAAGAALVSGMTYAPVVPRDPSLLACRERDGLTLCLWPEHVAQADEIAGIASGVRTRWLAAGIGVPAVFTEADRSIVPSGSLAIGVVTSTASDDVIADLAAGLIPPFPVCIDPRTGDEMGTTGGVATTWLQAWYAAAGGMSQGRLTEEYGSEWDLPGTTLDPLPTVDALLKVSPEARRAWAAHAAALVATCEEVEVDLTVRP